MSKDTKRRKIEYTCQYCQKTYKKPSKLAEHERSHTGERPFVCTHEGCNKSYIRSSHLTVHQRSVHSDTKNFVCSHEKCTASFATRQHLHRHENIHNSPLISCDYTGCDAQFHKRFQLRWHKAAHEKGTFHCKHCESQFDSLPALEKHENRVHENPVLYNCSSCEKTFMKWTELRKHVQAEHPLICTVCHKVYTKAFNLKQHIKEKHLEQEKIFCDWPGCESVLHTKRSYKMHVALVHEQDTRYKCGLCQKGFPYKSMLDRHIGSHTPKSKSNSPAPARITSIIQQITGHNDKGGALECPFPACQYKFNNTYLLRRHLESKNHAEDVESYAASIAA